MINIKKIHDTIGLETIQEMEAMDSESLKSVVISANTAMQQVQDELDANQEYQDLKLSKSAMEMGKREVDKRQKAKIKFAIHLLDEKGKCADVEASA